MATLPTREDNARKVLRIFKHFGTRPGEGIGSNNILAMAAKWHWRIADMQDGLQYGLDNGWFKNGQNGYTLLTETGYAEI